MKSLTQSNIYGKSMAHVRFQVWQFKRIQFRASTGFQTEFKYIFKCIFQNNFIFAHFAGRRTRNIKNFNLKQVKYPNVINIVLPPIVAYRFLPSLRYNQMVMDLHYWSPCSFASLFSQLMSNMSKFPSWHSSFYC